VAVLHLCPSCKHRLARPRLGIVGGGFAGLHAAQEALARWPDLHIEIFEKESRAGGRAVPIHLSNGQQVDAAPLRFHRTTMHRVTRLLQAFGQPVVPWPFSLHRTSERLSWVLEKQLRTVPFPVNACAELLQFHSLSMLPRELAVGVAAAFPEREPQNWCRPQHGFFRLAEYLAQQLILHPSC